MGPPRARETYTVRDLGVPLSNRASTTTLPRTFPTDVQWNAARSSQRDTHGPDGPEERGEREHQADPGLMDGFLFADAAEQDPPDRIDLPFSLTDIEPLASTPAPEPLDLEFPPDPTEPPDRIPRAHVGGLPPDLPGPRRPQGGGRRRGAPLRRGPELGQGRAPRGVDPLHPLRVPRGGRPAGRAGRRRPHRRPRVLGPAHPAGAGRRPRRAGRRRRVLPRRGRARCSGGPWRPTASRRCCRWRTGASSSTARPSAPRSAWPRRPGSSGPCRCSASC